MRNDARPIGEDSPASPVGGHEEPAADRTAPDSRDSVAHDRQSHIVNPPAEENNPAVENNKDATERWQTRRSIRRSEDR
jgi:hypothetical protein